MRILMFSNAYKPSISGVVTSISLFRQGLLEAGQEVSVIAPEYIGYVEEEPYTFRFPALDLTSQVDLSLVIPLKGLMERTVQGLKPQVIHSQHPVVMGSLAASFSRGLNIPMVFTFHTLYEEYTQKVLPIMPELTGIVVEEIISRYLDNFCAHVIAPTTNVRDMIRSKYHYDGPITVIPTPVDLHCYSDLLPASVRSRLELHDEALLAYVGRLSTEKNLDFLLQAFAILHSRCPDARLLLIGKGPMEFDLRRLAEQLDIAAQVLFAGPIDHNEVPHYIAAADLFVFPSSTETQGLVLIESMAAGTPVVAVEALSSQDVLSQGGGILVESEPAAFAEAVLELLNDPERRHTLGLEAKKAAQRFNIEASTSRLIDVYQQAIEAGPRIPLKI